MASGDHYMYYFLKLYSVKTKRQMQPLCKNNRVLCLYSDRMLPLPSFQNAPLFAMDTSFNNLRLGKTDMHKVVIGIFFLNYSFL